MTANNNLLIPTQYTLVQREYINELKCEAFLLEHNKTKARIFYLAADDDNKVFSVTFRTPPSDKTGVAHIMEHSVLCGSRKFPLKEPFVELVKGSLNTFLNAMTFPDKTMYPVASKNDQDFRNLMDVYLDAVFFPNAIKNSDTLKQEGWHYEILDQNEPLTYKGVVYNEMKGVYSAPDAILSTKVMETLFPNNTYGADSGGNPDNIPELTFDKFKNFYEQFYHPSNSYIFLYGKMDIAAQLEFIDAEYLSHFEYSEVDSKINLQKAFDEGIKVAFPYNITAEDSTENKCLHSLAYAMPEQTMELKLAFEVLTHALIGSSAAPLKEYLLKQGIGLDISGDYTVSMKQPVWYIDVNGSEREKGEQLEILVEKFIEEECQKGLDKHSLEASLNILEFMLREADFGGRPIGLAHNIRLMDEWLYDRNPFEALRYDDVLRKLRHNLNTDYYENILRKYILDNKHKALVTMYPQIGLTAEKQNLEDKYLAEIKANMSSAEIDNLIAENKRLMAKQAEPDSAEALASIPLLKLEDLDYKVEEIERREYVLNDVKIHHIPTNTNGILYSNLYFNLNGLNEEEIKYTYLISDILTRISTNTTNYIELDKKLNFYLGGLNTGVQAINKAGTDEYTPLFKISGKALLHNMGHMTEIFREILLESVFTDEQRIKELLEELKTVWDMDAFRKGHSLVSDRLLAQISNISKFIDCGGLGYYEFLVKLVKQSDYAEIANMLSRIASKIFAKNRLEIMVIGDDEQYHLYEMHLANMLQDWNLGSDTIGDKISLSSEYVNQGIISAGQVQYVAAGGNFKAHGYQFHGNMKVLETILKYDYLWTKIRVQGGAYGAFATFKPTGELIFCSYRDPNLIETLDVYKNMADYIKNLDISEREMRKYIIGTMSGLDIPNTPYLRGVYAMTRYYKGITATDVEKTRREVISSNLEEIKALSKLIEEIINDKIICAMGNEQKIKNASDYFVKISPLPN